VDELIKKKIIMKKILKISFVFLFVLGFVSCSEDDGDTLTGNNNTGGLISVKNALVGYVVGNGNTFEYKAGFSAFQGTTQVQSVDIYKQFTSVTDGTSSKVLLKTVTMPLTAQVENMEYTFTYDELRSGLTVGGSPISSSDATLNIGDFFLLTYKANTSAGLVVDNVQTTKVSVGTRFAGSYQVLTGLYWRVGVASTANWNGLEITIESVNATTYKRLEYAGPFSGNEFYFTINSSDVVNVPNSYDGAVQLMNGQPATNPTDNPGDLTNASAVVGLQNVVVRDDVNGFDKLYMTYGYLTAGSGPREFYEILEKL
jgi:hypothetical protein